MQVVGVDSTDDLASGVANVPDRSLRFRENTLEYAPDEATLNTGRRFDGFRSDDQKNNPRHRSWHRRRRGFMLGARGSIIGCARCNGHWGCGFARAVDDERPGNRRATRPATLAAAGLCVYRSNAARRWPPFIRHRWF